MRPFDIDEVLQGKQAITRDGRPAVIAACLTEAKKGQQVIGWLSNRSCSWNIDGTYDINGYTNEKDLFIKQDVQTRKGYLNVYPDTCYYYATREQADSYASADRLDCVPIEVAFKV